MLMASATLAEVKGQVPQSVPAVCALRSAIPLSAAKPMRLRIGEWIERDGGMHTRPAMGKAIASAMDADECER